MWTKNGSIPQNDTDGTEGWLEVPEMPAPVDGKEIVWLNWQWVVRDPKPDDRDGYRWKWNHDQVQWVEYQLPNAVISELPTDPLPALTSTDVVAMTSEQIGMLNG